MMDSRVRRFFIVGVVVQCFVAVSVPNALGQQRPGGLVDAPLEELLEIEVTSVARRPQRVADSAAAIFVLTQDDIRRSGATSIPEALRLVPGLYVARVDSNVWVVNSRGFSSRFSAKLLVLLDGRAVYTPVFSGVLWDVQDTALEDIDRIEVIRGPGAALWGVNAVNGVINIVTRRAQDTQGGMLSGGVGSEEAGFGTFRYGFRAGDSTIRAFAKWFDRREARLAAPLEGDAGDAWHIGRWGGRLDTDLGTSDTLTIIGEGYRGAVGEAAPIASLVPPYSVVREFDQPASGANLTARWQHAFSETSNFQLQAYYDRTRRHDLRALLRLDTFDLDFQHRLQWQAGRVKQNDLVWGWGYRFHHFGSEPGASLDFEPPGEDLRQSSAFVSNDTTVLAGKLHAIVGSKFEHTTFTGFEIEPSARVLFTPNADTGVWGAVSRAVRIPSLIERSGRFDIQAVPPGLAPLPTLLQFTGDSGFGSEKLLAYEAGYRRRVSRRIAADLAAFYNRYADSRDGAAQPPSLNFAPVPHFVVPVVGNNNLAGDTYGFESLVDFDSLKGWKLRGSYSFLRVETRPQRGGASVPGSSTLQGLAPPEFDEPRHQAYVRWAVTIWQVEIDVVPRVVSSLRNLGVPGYAELDARLAWRPSRRVEIAVAGRNLGHSTHQEFINANGGPVPAVIQREATLKATIRF
jgi:iron complex outermembrane receptor protein